MKLLLLHAFPLDHRMWEPQREALAGHDVVAPDLYPLGETIADWAGALLARVEGKFVAVGASMGGYCALAAAGQAPDRVAGLVLAGSRTGADTPERRAARADTIRLIEEGGASGLWDDMRGKLLSPGAPERAVALAEAIALEQEPPALVRAVEAIRDRRDYRDVAASFAGRLLVVAGDRDPFLAADEAREIAETAPEGRLLVFPDTGHLPSLERPDEFNRALLEYLVAWR